MARTRSLTAYGVTMPSTTAGRPKSSAPAASAGHRRSGGMYTRRPLPAPGALHSTGVGAQLAGKVHCSTAPE